MNIVVTISEHVQLAGAGAAAVAYNNALPNLPDGTRPSVVTTEAYLQSIVEKACLSYRDQYAVDRIPSAAFVMRFTPAEYSAIRAAGETDPIMAGFVQAVDEAPYVWLAAQQVIQGVNYCAVQGLITQERADEILAYSIPTPTSE